MFLKLNDVIQFFNPTMMLDTLFGGGGGGGNSQPANQTVTQQNAVSAYAAPYVEDMLGKAQALTDANTKYTPYSGQRTADFTGMQNQAFNAAGNLGVQQQTTDASNMAAQAGIGALNTQYDPMMAGTRNFGAGAANQYMSPYVQQALAPQMQQIARTGEQQKLGNAGQATQAGAFGGSRFGIQNAMTDYNTQNAQAGAYGTGMQNAFQNAQSQFNTDQARQLQAQQANIGQQQFGANLGMQGLSQANAAAQTLGQLGQNQYGQQTGNINLQNALGTQQQQQQQNVLNQQYQDFQTQKQNPYNQLSYMQSMLAGLPMTSSVQNVYSNPSMLSQVAGMGTTALAGAKLAGYAAGGSVSSGLADLGMYNALNQ